jgi:hypothetical protein
MITTTAAVVAAKMTMVTVAAMIVFDDNYVGPLRS